MQDPNLTASASPITLSVSGAVKWSGLLDDQVRSMLACKPELSWDDAVSALILKGIA